MSFHAKCMNAKFFVDVSNYHSQFGKIIENKQSHHFIKLKKCQIKHDQVNGKQEQTHSL